MATHVGYWKGQHKTDDGEFEVIFYPEAGNDEETDHWHDAGVHIMWTCGAMVGPWTVSDFNDLVKAIAKSDRSHPVRTEIPDDAEYIVWDDEGIIMYADSVGYDQRGPSLEEIRKAVTAIKRKEKTLAKA